jgi:hypothetical protein
MKNKRRALYYVLTPQGEPAPATSLDQIEEFLNTPDSRRVAFDALGDFEVSTIFLGIDYNFGQDGPPVLWETLIHNERLGFSKTFRCAGSREQALAMHAGSVNFITMNSLDQTPT